MPTDIAIRDVTTARERLAAEPLGIAEFLYHGVAASDRDLYRTLSIKSTGVAPDVGVLGYFPMLFMHEVNYSAVFPHSTIMGDVAIVDYDIDSANIYWPFHLIIFTDYDGVTRAPSFVCGW